ncbi:MAG: TolC family protein [Thermoanaerobaculaceae bacterium]|nr:TolC family protein [Thermoanaerobaculaceae bacterium]
MPREHPHDDRDRRRGTVRRASAAAVAVLAALAAAAAAAPVAGPLTLADALREIAAHSAAATAAALDTSAAREDTKRAEAAFHPALDLSGGFQLRDHEVVAKFGALQAPTGQSHFLFGEVDLTQLLWDGGRRSWAVAGARSAEHATAAGGRAEVSSAMLEGLGTYLRILTLTAQRRVVAQRVVTLQDHLREVHDLFDQGVVARNDLLATEVRLRLVQDQGGALANGETVATAALNRLMGRDPAEAVALPGTMPPPPPLAASAAELAKRAAKANPQLLALQARLKTEEDAVALKKSDDKPSLFAQASHTYQQNQYLVYPNANFLMLGASWQPYDGGARAAAVRAAAFRAERTRTEIADLQRQIDVQVEQAFLAYRQALTEAATAETNVAAATENLRIEEDQYKAGLAKSTDVLDAEAVLADARFALVNQHFNAYLKQGVLLTLAGEDLPTFFAAVGTKEQEP